MNRTLATLLCSLATLALAGAADAAQSTPTTPATTPATPATTPVTATPGTGTAATKKTTLAPLGLPRVESKTKGTPSLAKTKFTVDDLKTTGTGATAAKKGDTDYVALSPNAEWTRPLRGAANDVTFVSFLVYGSENTVIDVGGVRLGLVAGPAKGALQLAVDESTTLRAVGANGPEASTPKWRPLGFRVPEDVYGGKSLAAMPPLTVRLDPSAGVWDLFAGNRLLADNVPLAAAKKDLRQFTVKAGANGAWVCGLVLADENPLFVDANANGIDDAFEKQQRGGTLLAATATVADRTALAAQWKTSQAAKPPAPLKLIRPLPDALDSAPKGK